MQPSSPYKTQALARRLNSADDAARKQAQIELQALLAADVHRITHGYIVQNVLSTAFVLLLLPTYFHAWVTGQNPLNGFVVATAATSVGIQYLVSLPARQCARRIAALNIPQAVGPLIEVLMRSGWFRSRHVKAALIRLLPHLQPTDAGLLTPLQRKYLGGMLCRDKRFPWGGTFWDADLKIAILRSLEQIGDQKALVQVEQMARSAHDFRVRFAAQQCLPFLQQRARQTEIEQTLLRASAQNTTPDLLVRPVSSPPPAEPQLLLRASVPSDAD